MATEFNGTIEVDIRDSEPDWGPYQAPVAPKDAPSTCTGKSCARASLS